MDKIDIYDIETYPKELEQMREQTDVYLKLVERDDIYVPFVIMDFKSKTMKLIRKIDGEKGE